MSYTVHFLVLIVVVTSNLRIHTRTVQYNTLFTRILYLPVGLPPDYSRRGSISSGPEASQDLVNVPSVLHLLCDKFLGSLIEVKTIREHSLKPLLLELLSDGTLV